VDAAKRFVPDEALETLDAESELAMGETALAGQPSFAKPAEMLGQGVLRPVDDSQVGSRCGSGTVPACCSRRRRASRSASDRRSTST
jgi:hypothetical protein